VAAESLAALAGTDLYLALAIVGLPLLGSAAAFLFGRSGMWRGGALFPIAAITGSLLCSLVFLVRTLGGAPDAGWSTTWFTAGGIDFPFGILLDHLSVWLASLVSLLSLLIVVFSTRYLADEPDDKLRRYYAVKSLFVAGMLGTVLLDNYLLLFIFWEVMGVCSYLLIGYWYTRESAARAAKKAFLVTRLGDILLFMGILLLLALPGHTLSFRALFAQLGDGAFMAAHRDTVFWAGLLIFGGAVGKSAQFPLDIWLPDAMEGPTTVSALIHAATMVKAGVYLVARTWPLYVALGATSVATGALSGETLFLLIGAIGGFTALYTATMALVATDIKRVLAFSTLSQLGYMFLALGAGGVLYLHTGSGAGFTAALLHLMNHAFFKALLFLGSASVILGLHHHQDLREMGGLRARMPVTFWTMLIGSLSIAGIIPLSGFWSKDEVLSAAFGAGSSHALFFALWAMGIATALLTAFYMFRMMWLAFGGAPRSEHAEHAHESPLVMTVPLMVLAVAAAVSGLWLVAGPGFSSLIHYPYSTYLGEAEVDGGSTMLHEIFFGPHAMLTYLSLALALLGIGLASARYRSGLPATEAEEPQHGWRRVLYRRYFVTEAVYEPLGNVVAVGVARISNWFDRKGIDGAVNGIARGSDRLGARTRRIQDGRLTTYMATLAVGVLLLLALGALVVLANWRWTA